MNAIVPSNSEAYRASTDAASLCRDIVVATAKPIQGRNFVSVEGWQAIAIAHGCAAGARDVERVEGGVRAIGEVRRMVDGVVISTAEGFVGEDEPTWYGGQMRGKTLPKRADYAIRAMAQTRAISRACRSAFAHVVVMMKADLDTTPAEEVPQGGFDNGNVVEADFVRNGPEPRTKLEGPHTSKTALRKAVNDLRALARKCEDVACLNDLLRGAKETIAQAERDWPQLLNGDPSLEEDIGLKGEVAQRRQELQSTPSALLIADLKANAQTKSEFDVWFDLNMIAVDELDDSERRLFEAAAEEFESGLLAVARVNAG